MPQGKRVTSKEKDLVCRVWKFFEKESRQKPRDRIGVTRVMDRLRAATGFSFDTLNKIKQEYRSESGVQSTPKKARRYSRPRLQINVDDFDRAAIRRAVYSFYEKERVPNADLFAEGCQRNESICRRSYNPLQTIEIDGFQIQK